MDDEVTVIASMQSSYIFDAINISFNPHFADDDNLARRLYNDDCEVSKLWGSTHCHWNPSGPGAVQQLVFGPWLWHTSFQQSQYFSTFSIQEGLDILDSMLAGTATIEETVITILEQIFWGEKNKKIESYDMNP